MTTPPVDQATLETQQIDPATSALVPVTSGELATVPHPGPTPGFLRRWAGRLAWTVVFAGTALGAGVGGALVATTIPLPDWIGPQASEPLGIVDLWQSGFRYRLSRPVNVLMLGVDTDPDAHPNSPAQFATRTDTMLLARFNPDQGTVNLLSIPRDTRVTIPGRGIAKINHANVVGGPELVAETIQSNIGPIAVDRYLRIDTGGFRELVDLAGGIEVYVPRRMQYEDRTQGLSIDLQPGWQTLNGDQAEQFARFRSDGQGDVGRVQRQQMLLRALKERLIHPRVVPQLPQLIRVMLRYVDTNLTLEEILALANYSLEIGTDNLQMVMLPGRFSTQEEYIASYWIMDNTATQQVMNQFFQLNTVALLSGRESGRGISQLRIAVQNGSNQSGAANTVARTLRQRGFTNVYVVPDWSGTVRRTQVIAQRGDLNSAEVVSSVLGLGTVVPDSTGDLESDLTVRIGQDWSEESFLSPVDGAL